MKFRLTQKVLVMFISAILLPLGVQADNKSNKVFNAVSEETLSADTTTVKKIIQPLVIQPLSEMEEQQKILQQYKPLIKPRTYDDLITYLNPDVTPLTLNRLPDLSELMTPGRAPDLRLIPYLRKSFAHPAYRARLNGMDYLVAVNCNDPSGFDDCSTSPHNQFKTKRVYVRFIQTSDNRLEPVVGLKVGRLYSQVQHLFADEAKRFGDGECLQTQSDWIACFDSTEMTVNKKTLKMMPSSNAKLRRFLKIKGRAY